MPLPASITPVTVTGTYLDYEGNPDTGTIKFRARQIIASSSDDTQIAVGSIEVDLDSNGQFQVDLIPTDDPQWVPSGWSYYVIESLGSEAGRRFFMEVPYDALGGTLDLADASMVPDEEVPTGFFIPLSQKGVPSGVASLDGTGRVPTAQLPAPSGGDAVQSVNGDVGPNVILTAADVDAANAAHTHSYVPTSEKGVANGVATLDSGGKLPVDQLPAIASGVTSVNGETGVVTLSAADVDALPDNSVIDENLIPKTIVLGDSETFVFDRAAPNPAADPILRVESGTHEGLVVDNEGAVTLAARTATSVPLTILVEEDSETDNISQSVFSIRTFDGSTELSGIQSDGSFFGPYIYVLTDATVFGNLLVDGTITSPSMQAQSWQAVTFASGAANSGGSFANCASRKEVPESNIRLRGRMTFSGSFVANATVATIDALWRPVYTLTLACRTSTGSATMTITTAGEIQVNQAFSASNWLSLDGITYTIDI